MALIARRNVSGSYRGRRHGFEVHLRVDLDGPRPMNRVSADYYRVSECEYLGSMRIDAPVMTVSALRVVITGTAVFSMRTKCKCVVVTIPFVPISSMPAPATLQHLADDGVPETAYGCKFTSTSFREVELEEACEIGVDAFESYDTASLPSHGTPRRLTHTEAFDEAGIEMLSTGPRTIVDTSAAGENATWSDAELHAAMQDHFSRWGDRPRWAIWLLHAASHDDERIGGLMFDQRGPHRQGCAVFYGHGTDTRAETLRGRLHTCVHELGHGFNLPHSWQRSLTEPPIPSNPAATSWMNYPDRYPGGPDEYWSEFDFGFDDSELIYLRHAFAADVIMGGNPFAGGGARDREPGWDVEELQDPGLRLKLSAPPRLVRDVPVTVRLELSVETREDRAVHPILGPRPGNVDIAIRRPDGTVIIFEPLLHHCRGGEMRTLRAGDQPVCDHAFIHYGKGGFTFKSPGRYLVRARYVAPDGPIVLSNVASIRVIAPMSSVDRDISELIADDDQVGELMSLTGSDGQALQRGNNRLEEIIDRYPTHPTATIGRLARAANLARGFKQLNPDGTVRPREPKIIEAAALVTDVLERRWVQLPATPAAGHQAAGRARGQISLRPGVHPSVAGFFNSRHREMEAAVEGYGVDVAWS